jgi:hypothetical protein
MTITDFIISSLLPLTILHIVEEYWIPGGFFQAFKRMMIKVGLEVTVLKIIWINILFLILVSTTVWLGKSNLFLLITTTSLTMINGILHVIKAIQKKQYFPGLVTSLLGYIPLGITAFFEIHLNTEAKILAGITAISLHTVPIMMLMLKIKNNY